MQSLTFSQAIARAVYSRKKIAVFDDVFSGLDKITEQKVFTRIFARGGLLRKNGTLTVLATHTGTFLMEAMLFTTICSRIHLHTHHVSIPDLVLVLCCVEVETEMCGNSRTPVSL